MFFKDKLTKYKLPIILAAFLFSGCGFQGEYPAASYIVTASIGDARSLIPMLATDTASAEICSVVYNGLVKYDKDINLVGDLAQSWEILDEGVRIIFHLRKDVKWHDGVGFSAKDVEFTYKKLIDPQVKTAYGGDFQKIKQLNIIDDYTVEVIYNEPHAPAISSWGMPIIAYHLLKDEDLNTSKHARAPVGTGPYKFRKWITGEKIELVSNSDYFEGSPRIDNYIYRIIPDNAGMFLELQAGGVDIMDLTPLQYKRQTDTPFFKNNFNKYKYASFGYTYLGYNLKNEKFKDLRVRQALDFAVDKNELIDGVLLGLGRIDTGPFVPESWAYNPGVRPRPFDPEKAKELLKEAGWQDTDNDSCLDKDGQAFEFTIMVNQGNDSRAQAAQIIQKRLAQIGVKVKIKTVEWSVMITEFINKRRFEAVLMGWGLAREPDCFDIWHSSKTKEGEFNFISYNNPEVDELLVKGRRIFDKPERAKIYHRVHEILYDEQPYMFLWIADSLPIVNKRIKGIEAAPAGIYHDFIHWYIEPNNKRGHFAAQKTRK
ncbi:MAG: peptide-binding protein [Candidatus Omnitrophota bacterium]